MSTNNEFWPRSFPELVYDANRLMALGKYRHAERVYLRAADLAISEEHETALLTCAWIARMRVSGRRSELEGGTFVPEGCVVRTCTCQVITGLRVQHADCPVHGWRRTGERT